jgi:hypothetical protein
MPASVLQTLNDTATKQREVLFSETTTLAKRGLIDGQRLKDLKGPVGYRNVAFDLLALVAIFRETWNALTGKTGISMEELEKAEVMADELLGAVAERELGQVVADAADNRQRAFTLFVNAYDQVRRAVLFLRHDEDDADTIIPSLYAGRSNRRRIEPTEEPKPPEVTAPTTQTTAPAQSAVNGVGVGLPGSSPFAH